MRQIAGFALTIASLFLVTVAIMLNSSALFYMSTALIATLLGARIQAWLSVRGLRFERIAPEAVRVGELVTVQITVWSEKRLRRPLITIVDQLPPRLRMVERSPSLPIAPAFDLPLQTQYQFRAHRRGKFKWSGLTAIGTDAVGLITMRKQYRTEPTEITVFARPIPVAYSVPMAAGWGISEAESGNARGAGIEPRGVREFTAGDALRHVHWRTSARARRLMVKEFEAGSHAVAAFLLQRTEGTDLGVGPETSLDVMCGNVAYLTDMFLRQGVRVEFPGLEGKLVRGSPQERRNEIDELLASVQADTTDTVGAQVLRAKMDVPPGSTLFVFAIVADSTLPEAVREVTRSGFGVVAMLYDVHEFQLPGKRVTNEPSATDEQFVALLEGAGAHVVLPSLEGGAA